MTHDEVGELDYTGCAGHVRRLGRACSSISLHRPGAKACLSCSNEFRDRAGGSHLAGRSRWSCPWLLHLRPRDRQAPLFDYSVALDPAGRIRQVDILAYRESYGGEIRSPSWLAQFVGKSNASPLQLGNDIRNISGATLSSQHVTEGVKRIMAIANRLK